MLSETPEHVREFDCLGCGRHIVSLAHPATAPLMCGMCLVQPKWWRYPELARAIDPDHLRTVDRQ